MAVILESPNAPLSTSNLLYTYTVPAGCCVVLSKASFNINLYVGAGGQVVMSLIVANQQAFYVAPYLNDTGGETSAIYHYEVDFGPEGLIVGPGGVIQVTLVMGTQPSGASAQAGFFVYGDLLNG